MTIQEQLIAKLESTGLPHKQIHCYGSQIVVTAWSQDAANQWASVLGKFAKVRGIVKSIDENKISRGSFLLPTIHNVYRVFARI